MNANIKPTFSMSQDGWIPEDIPQTDLNVKRRLILNLINLSIPIGAFIIWLIGELIKLAS